jgi:hypothetical protein
MTNSKPVLAVMMLAASLPISSAEAAQSGNYNGIDTGSSSCGSWTAWRREGRALLPQQWILGFLSGVGYVGVDDQNPLNGVDVRDAEAAAFPRRISAALTPLSQPVEFGRGAGEEGESHSR